MPTRLVTRLSHGCALLALILPGIALASPSLWTVGPGHTLQTPGTIVKLEMVSKRKARYLLTGHGDLREAPIASASGKVPAAKLELKNGAFMWYAFLANDYPPGTEPLKLSLHQKVWIRSHANWPTVRVFPR